MPHSEKRFVGYNRDDKSLDADTLRKFIYGGAVADYMNEMEVRFCCILGDNLRSCCLEGTRHDLYCIVTSDPLLPVPAASLHVK